MQWVGDRSFSMYLLHPPVVYYLDHYGVFAAIAGTGGPLIGPWTLILLVGVTFMFVLPLSALTYRLIEVPGQSLGNLLVRGIEHRYGIIPAVAK